MKTAVISRAMTLMSLLSLFCLADRAAAQQAPRRFDQAPATLLQQPQSIDYSDAYYTRLTIHRIGSYAMLPLFAGEYLLGEELIDGGASGWVRSAHGAVATTLGVLFVTNTVTGAWNLWESRKDPEGRTKRFVHSAIMTAAAAGIAYTASLAPDDDDGAGDDAGEHRDAAILSMSVGSVGTLLMWLWNN